ncbi:MAG: hypothetical protein JWO31_1192 [Phycisphaerales bacterium]|nr:hypothetical protein [Phycisphaerales bacterium]
MSLIKLADVAKPTIDLELPDGGKRSYDLWELGERYNALDAATTAKAGADGSVDLPAFYDGVRGLFGFPTLADAAKVEGTFTLSRGMCEHLRTVLVEELTKREERVRFFAALRPPSSTSTGSSPRS